MNPAKPTQTPVPASIKDSAMVAQGLKELEGGSATEASLAPEPIPHMELAAPPAHPPPPNAVARRKLTTDQLAYMRDQISLPSTEGQQMTVSLPDHPQPFILQAHLCKSRPDLEKGDHFRWRVLDVDPVL